MRRVVLALLTLLALVAAPGVAGAQEPEDRPTSVVSMGDSYISGEGGRWEGNADYDYADRWGTDRAAYRNRWGWWRYDEARVYGPSGANGCHRSDVAPVLSSAIEVDRLVNLACSGADTDNLIRAANGGSGQKGEPSQADQLVGVAATTDVEMVVVSIGGNDLGFADIIIDCALGYVLSSSLAPVTCHDDQQELADARMADVTAGVDAVLDEVRAVLAEAGQGPGTYRLVLQSYPSPVPSGDEFRYRQSGLSRTFTGGCPFWDVDATWARDVLVPRLSDELAAVASANGADFLDLRDALEGREVCAETADQGDDGDAEWARFVSTGILQGEIQESMHPNALGQQANGTCLRLLHAAGPGHFRCDNVPGAGPATMTLTPIAAPAVPAEAR